MFHNKSFKPHTFSSPNVPFMFSNLVSRNATSLSHDNRYEGKKHSCSFAPAVASAASFGRRRIKFNGRVRTLWGIRKGAVFCLEGPENAIGFVYIALFNEILFAGA